MKKRSVPTIVWVGCYLALALGPLALLTASGRTLPSRGFWIECSAALGFIAMAMFALQFVLTARFKGVAAPHGLDAIIQFHREAGLAAVAFALLHPLVMIAKEPGYLEYLDPRIDLGRSVLLIAAVLAMLLIVLLTLGRRRLSLPYEWWRLSHGLLGLFVVLAALIHVLQVEWYIAERWQRTLWIALTGGAAALLAHVRLGKPLAMRRAPWRVAAVRKESRRTWTIALEPVRHGGMRFRAGQFAWLTLSPTPFSMQQHPFSFSSSAECEDRIEFTIRELGDFTSTIGGVKPGETAFVEGPYGAFVPDLEEQFGLALIAGGVGIAPIMSILRTLRDRGDRRPVRLIYGARDTGDVIFADELQSMKNDVNLELVVVLEEEQGRINEEVLDRFVTGLGGGDFHYFICGPGPMMDVAETYLNRAGAPASHIHTERFDIA